MLDKKSHVDRTIKRIEQKIQIGILRQFTAPDCTLQRQVGFPAARPKEALTEVPEQSFVALPGSQDGRNDASHRTAKDFYQLAHLAAQIGIE